MKGSCSTTARFAAAAFLLLLGVAFAAAPAFAAVSATGGSGVWDVQSAESKRPGRLELGFASNYGRLPFYDALDTRLNGLQGSALAAFGLPGGFEVSGSLPVFGFHTSRGDASAFDSNIDTRIGDVAARLRWSGPLGMPGMRWGLEGGATLPTGSEATIVIPGRGALQPFTSGTESYTGRFMTTFDGVRSGSGVPLRLHANAAFTQQRDESRFLTPYSPLPLDLPVPARDRDNDRLTLGAAAELDLARVTLFGEVLTDQFVYDRTTLRGQENYLAVTPGFNFWLPGGVALTGAYTLLLSTDDAATAFDPTRAYPNHEWKVALSLGTVYRGARARAEDDAAMSAAMVTTVAPAPAPAVPVSAAPTPAPAAVAPAPVAKPAPADSAAVAKAAQEKVIIERRPIQEAPAKATARAAAAVDTTLDAGSPEIRPVPAAGPGPAPAPARATPATPSRFADTDGDGIPDAQDHCPLLAEDWDGFQDFDGCPDVDNDQDGIPDIRDRCPNDPETYNGYYDFDGCPDDPNAPRVVREMVERTEFVPAESSERAPATGPAPGAATPALAPAKPLTPVAPPAAVAPAPLPAPAKPAQAAPAPAPATVSPAGARPAATPAAPAKSMAPPAEEPAGTSQAPASAATSQVPAAAAPAARPTATAAGQGGILSSREAEMAAKLEAERQRSDALEMRLRALELRQDQSSMLAGSRPTTVTVPTGAAPSPGVSPTSARLGERVARLEGGREAAAETAPAGAAAPAGTAAVDSTSARLVSQMKSVQASLDSLRDAAAAAPSAEPVAAEDPAVHWLQLELPLGQSRVFSQIVFEPGSARLTAAARQSLTAVAGALRRVPGSRLQVVGYTDDTGDPEANRALSRERAQSVADALVALGAWPDQLTVEGRGDSSPIASNRTARGREQNRRVELTRTR